MQAGIGGGKVGHVASGSTVGPVPDRDFTGIGPLPAARDSYKRGPNNPSRPMMMR